MIFSTAASQNVPVRIDGKWRQFIFITNYIAAINPNNAPAVSQPEGGFVCFLPEVRGALIHFVCVPPVDVLV